MDAAAGPSIQSISDLRRANPREKLLKAFEIFRPEIAFYNSIVALHANFYLFGIGNLAKLRLHDMVQRGLVDEPFLLRFPFVEAAIAGEIHLLTIDRQSKRRAYWNFQITRFGARQVVQFQIHLRPAVPGVAINASGIQPDDFARRILGRLQHVFGHQIGTLSADWVESSCDIRRSAAGSEYQ